MLTEEDGALYEETRAPLLAQAEALESGPSPTGLSKHDKQYDRFSPSQKRVIVGLLSWVGLLPFLASGSFVPYCASLFGPAIAPVAGGLATHYATWRLMQWALFFMGLSAYILFLLLFPETLDPEVASEQFRVAGGVEGRRFVWLNPVKNLALLRSPNILIVTIAGSTTFLTDYVMLIPLSFTIGKAYNITNEAIVGMFFLAFGLGNIVGAPIAGHYADRAVIKGRERRGGQWVPEDRLHATLFGAVVLVPLSMLISGLATQFIPGTPGIVINVFCLFANGIAVDLELTPSSSYHVDILHSRSAEVWAGSSAVRQFSVALATAGILPLINAVGVVVADALFAVVAWVGFLLIVITIRYGDRMRAWVDVGYSTAETN